MSKRKNKGKVATATSEPAVSEETSVDSTDREFVSENESENSLEPFSGDSADQILAQVDAIAAAAFQEENGEEATEENTEESSAVTPAHKPNWDNPSRVPNLRLSACTMDCPHCGEPLVGDTTTGSTDFIVGVSNRLEGETLRNGFRCDACEGRIGFPNAVKGTGTRVVKVA